MSFASVEFIIFLGAAILIYYLMPRKHRWLALLAISYGFYLLGGAGAAVYLLFATLTTYFAGLLLGALNRKKDALSGEEKKAKAAAFKAKKQLIAAGAIFLNFFLLYILKYWNFTADVMMEFSEGGVELPKIELLMPLGISFYIFQSVGYVVDCYRGKYPPEKNLLKYALFVSFFPQLVQGPISRYDHLAPQLTAERPFNPDHLKYGIQLAMWGYIKKLVIADRTAVLVNTVFSAPEKYNGGVIAVAVLMYCVQLYCDFSGGIDITRGVAQMLGIDLAENFKRPIFAQSLADYWRRWHITLGQWMKDYVFYSLTLSKPFLKLGKFTRRKIGGKLGKVIPTSCATFIVYLIIGIWHGANFRYIFYGFCNGAIITSSLLLANWYYACRQKMKISDDSIWLKGFRMVRTWILVFFGRYITRAANLKVAFSMIGATFTRPALAELFNGTLLKLGLSAEDLWVILFGVIALLILEYFQERGIGIRKWLEGRSFWVQWLAILIPMVILLLLGIMRGNYISSEFIYKQF